MGILSISKVSEDLHDKLVLFTTKYLEYPVGGSMTINIQDEMLNKIKKLTKNTSNFIRHILAAFVERTPVEELAFSRSELIRFILFDWYLSMKAYNLPTQVRVPTKHYKIIEELKKDLPRVLETTIIENPNGKVKEIKPWNHATPKKLLNVFPRDIDKNLIISFLLEHKNLNAKGLGILMSLVPAYVYQIVNGINRLHPDLILKIREYKNQIHHYELNKAVLMPLLK